MIKDPSHDDGSSNRAALGFKRMSRFFAYLPSGIVLNLIPVVLLEIAFVSAAYAQSDAFTLQKADSLVSNKKYDSAFALLDKADPNNNDIGILLEKENIVLDYFATSIMHRLFGLRDLDKNQDIMDVRGKEGMYTLYLFPADSIINRLIKEYPDSCRLYEGLGRYYYEVYEKYDTSWLVSDSILLDRIALNYGQSIARGCGDYYAYFIMGYVSVLRRDYASCIPYFLKSIEMNKEYASSYYNVAYAYLYMNDRTNALKYALPSIDLYTDVTYKSDAERMTGEIYCELGQDSNAIRFLKLSDSTEPGNYYTLKMLLGAYLRLGDTSAAMRTVPSIFNLEPQNPTVYNDLISIYSDFNSPSHLIPFFRQRIPLSAKDTTVLGSLYFYLGELYLDVDKKIARDYFLKAKTTFQNIYPKGHQVFEAIEEGLKAAAD